MVGGGGAGEGEGGERVLDEGRSEVVCWVMGAGGGWGGGCWVGVEVGRRFEMCSWV